MNNYVDDEDKAFINDASTAKGKLNDSKTFKFLGSTSAVPAFKPNKPINQKITPLESVRQSKRLDKLVKNDQNKETQIKKQKKSNSNVKYDLWSEKEKTPIGDVYVDFVEDFEKVRLSRIFKCPSKPNSNVLKKPSLLPAVEEPHPGLSYNPNKDEHTDLLILIGEKKKKEIRDKRKLNKRAKQGFDPKINVALENAKEMASGLFSGDEEEDKNEIDEQTDVLKTKDVIISDLKRIKSKKAKRNAIRERMDKIRSKRRKAKKRFETAFTKLKHFVKEAKLSEQKSKLRKQAKEQRKIDKLYRPARLGREKYTDPEPEFCLESELHGSLRKINTDGNLMMDRFKSLQRRNLIEHRRVQLRKRSKVLRKRVIRNSIYNKDLFEKEFLEPDN